MILSDHTQQLTLIRTSLRNFIYCLFVVCLLASVVALRCVRLLKIEFDRGHPQNHRSLARNIPAQIV
jgi:hypothetical protein